MKKFVTSKKLAGLLLFALSEPVQAGLIQWKYEATISLVAGSTDTLGVGGEAVTILLTFDDTDFWQAPIVGGVNTGLYFPAHAASTTISNHTAALNTALPAVQYITSQPFAASIAEAVGIPSFVDLIIDGQQTAMTGFYGGGLTTNPHYPSNLLPGHLPSYGFWDAQIKYPPNAPGAVYEAVYDLIDPSVTISTVPEPATLAFMGTGLVGLSLLRRRKRTRP